MKFSTFKGYDIVKMRSRHSRNLALMKNLLFADTSPNNLSNTNKTAEHRGFLWVNECVIFLPVDKNLWFSLAKDQCILYHDIMLNKICRSCDSYFVTHPNLGQIFYYWDTTEYFNMFNQSHGNVLYDDWVNSDVDRNTWRQNNSARLVPNC